MKIDKASILNRKPELTPISIPEWGPGPFTLRPMTGRQRELIERSTTQNAADIRARTVAYCLADEAGSLVFDEADIPAVNALEAPTLRRIFDACEPVNAVSKAALEGLVKN